MGRTVRTVVGHRLVVLVSLGTEKNGCLISLGIRDGFVVVVDLERRFSFHEDSSIRIVGFRFCERMGSHFIARHAFHFGVVYIFWKTLDGAFVCRQVDLLSADVAFSPSAQVVGDAISTVMHLGVWFIDVTAVRALFVLVAGGSDAEAPSLQVVIVTLVSEEFLVT